MSQNFFLSDCPSCRAQNRIPVSRLTGEAKCGSCKTAISPGDWHSAEPVSITDDSFRTLIQKSRRPVLVDFWAPWCGPCRQVAPILEDMARRFQGELLIVKVNVDENPVTASSMGIASIPSLVLFRDGKVLNTMVGALPKHKLEAWLNQMLGLNAVRN